MGGMVTVLLDWIKERWMRYTAGHSKLEHQRSAAAPLFSAPMQFWAPLWRLLELPPPAGVARWSGQLPVPAGMKLQMPLHGMHLGVGHLAEETCDQF